MLVPSCIADAAEIQHTFCMSERVPSRPLMHPRASALLLMCCSNRPSCCASNPLKLVPYTINFEPGTPDPLPETYARNPNPKSRTPTPNAGHS